MMGHGKHCNCMIYSMGEAIGMIEKCTDKNCTDLSHTEEKGTRSKKAMDDMKGCIMCHNTNITHYVKKEVK